jgi:hypothetical protein
MVAVFDDRLALTGYGWAGNPRPGRLAKLILRWRALAPWPDTGYHLSAELVAEAGEVVQVLEGTVAPPADSVLASDWLDRYYDVPLPTGIPPGTYHVRIRLVDSMGHMLRVRQGWPASPGDAAELAGLVVTSPPPGDALTNLENKAILVRRSLDQEEVRPGGTLDVTLYWRAAAKIDEDYTVFVHVLDATPRVRAQVDAFPAGGTRPTSHWRPGELVADAYRIPIPADLPSGEYQIEVGMYLAATMQRLQVIDEDERPIDDRVILGTIRVRND